MSPLSDIELRRLDALVGFFDCVQVDIVSCGTDSDVVCVSDGAVEI